MFSGLDAVMAPLALHARPPGRPLEVRSGEAVACLQLIESGGEALVGACHDGPVRLLLFARPVLCAASFRELSTDPVPGLRPLSLGEVALEVSEGPIYEYSLGIVSHLVCCVMKCHFASISPGLSLTVASTC